MDASDSVWLGAKGIHLFIFQRVQVSVDVCKRLVEFSHRHSSVVASAGFAVVSASDWL